MPELSKDVVALLQYLLPGFLVAWVFYGVTSHQKPAQAERIIQALIFTLVVRVCLMGERWILEGIGQKYPIRAWDSDSELLASLCSAIVLGFVIAFVVERDILHGFLRYCRISKRSSHPSEWYGTLAGHAQYAVFQLKDERRLYGWPERWPSDPEKGHFFVIHPSWLTDDGGQTELASIGGLLIDVRDVKWIEFIKQPEIMNGNQNSRSPDTGAPNESTGSEGKRECQSTTDLPETSSATIATSTKEVAAT